MQPIGQRETIQPRGLTGPTRSLLSPAAISCGMLIGMAKPFARVVNQDASRFSNEDYTFIGMRFVGRRRLSDENREER